MDVLAPITPQSLTDSTAGETGVDGSVRYEFVSWWFTAPDSWLIDQAPGGVKRMPPSAQDLDDAITTLRHWFRDWTKGRPNPFFHAKLYKDCLPACLQDAYLTLSAYDSATWANQETISNIVLHKAEGVVQARHAEPFQTELDPRESLAYAQALLVYQVIGLFDGRGDLRRAAEGHISVLSDWIHEAVEKARQAQPLGRFLLARREILADISWQTSAWYSWVLAESIRRTWLMISMVQGIYLTSQDGIDHCLGGMMFTSRVGFWEAQTALEWQQKCTEIYGGLVRLTEMNKLFSTIDPTELDEYAELVLKVTFSSEQLERWKKQSRQHHVS